MSSLLVDWHFYPGFLNHDSIRNMLFDFLGRMLVTTPAVFSPTTASQFQDVEGRLCDAVPPTGLTMWLLKS